MLFFFFPLVYIALGWLSSSPQKHKSLNFDTSPIPGGGKGEFRRPNKKERNHSDEANIGNFVLKERRAG